MPPRDTSVVTTEFTEVPATDRTWTDHSLFCGLSAEAAREISRFITMRHYRAGATVLTVGDAATHLYVVQRGTVHLLGGAIQQPVVLHTLSRGDVFGEMGLLTDGSSPVSALVETDAILTALSRPGLDLLISHNFSVATHLLGLVNARSLDLERYVDQVAVRERAVRMVRRAAGVPGTGMLPPLPDERHVIAIFSPTGGTGKTMVAVNLAVALARRYPRRVALLDLALTGSQCALILNTTSKASVLGYTGGDMAQLDGLDDVTWQTELGSLHSSSLCVVTMAHSPLEAVGLTPDQIDATLTGLSSAFSHVIIDMTSCYSDPNLVVLKKATRILLVSNHELTSLRCLIEFMRALDDPDAPVGARTSLILNSTKAKQAIRVQDFQARLAIPVLAQLPYGDEAPSLAASDGVPLIEKYAQLPLTKEIQAIADRGFALAPRAVSA